VSIWSYVDANQAEFRNTAYTPSEYDKTGDFLPIQPSEVKFWASYYLRWETQKAILVSSKIIRNEFQMFNIKGKISGEVSTKEKKTPATESAVKDKIGAPSLDLANQGLHFVPWALSQSNLDKPAVPETWKGLDLLSLGSNMLHTFSLSLGHFGALQRMDLSGNQLVVLSDLLVDSFGSLASTLVELDLRNNKLMRLPDQVSLLTSLKVLDISGNSLQELPVLSDLVQLTRLDMGRNPKLESFGFPHTLLKLVRLEWLGIFGNGLPSLPSSMWEKMQNLKHISMGGNNFTSIPLKLDTLTQLESININRLQVGAVFPILESLCCVSKFLLS